MAIKRVKIPCNFLGKVEFALGPGPCGKDVLGLETEWNDGAFTLRQFHSDGTSKTFIYPYATLWGRVEIETERAN